MKVLVWGLGYVGTVSAACLARLGHDVVGIEINADKVRAINEGRVLIKEPGLEGLVQQALDNHQLRATAQGTDLVSGADLSLICVGTPSDAEGATQLSHLQAVARDIGEGLRRTSHYHVVAVRSTVFPGTSRQFLRPILEDTSGKKAGETFELVVNPEFLREGSGVRDFQAPPYVVIGALDDRSAGIVSELYARIPAPIRQLTLEEAELIKITNNAFHGLKIGFANEIGRLCDALEIDSHKLMALVCEDTKLNISPAYLKPGFAFGGPCLRKDLRCLHHNAQRLKIDTPILSSILPSNRIQMDVVQTKLRALGRNRVGILGLSFKAGTDDVRESPVVELIQTLLASGFEVRVFDPDVVPHRMLGSNLEWLTSQIAAIREILCERSEDLIQHAEVIVVSQKRSEFEELLSRPGREAFILDLVRITDDPAAFGATRYAGVSW